MPTCISVTHLTYKFVYFLSYCVLISPHPMCQSILDEVGYNATNSAAMRTLQLCQTSQWKEATRWWRITEVVVRHHTTSHYVILRRITT